MDLFTLFIQAIKESDRLAADTSLSAADRSAATVLGDSLRSLKGAAFRYRHMAPPATTPPK